MLSGNPSSEAWGAEVVQRIKLFAQLETSVQSYQQLRALVGQFFFSLVVVPHYLQAEISP